MFSGSVVMNRRHLLRWGAGGEWGGGVRAGEAEAPPPLRPSFHQRPCSSGLLAADREEANCFSAFVVQRGSVVPTFPGGCEEKEGFFLGGAGAATRQSERTSRVVFLPLLSQSSGGQHMTFS